MPDLHTGPLPPADYQQYVRRWHRRQAEWDARSWWHRLTHQPPPPLFPEAEYHRQRLYIREHARREPLAILHTAALRIRLCDGHEDRVAEAYS